MNKSISELLEIRQSIKEKKTDFIRQDYQRRKRLGGKLKWRKPKGIHSKIRHGFKGWRKMPSPGYKSPTQVKGLHSIGLRIVNVRSIDDVKKIKKEEEGIIISRQVGLKKKLEIMKKAKELNLTVLNFNIDNKLKEIESFVNSKNKTKPKKEPKQQKEPKQKEESALTGKEKKDFEKKEKDRLLTKKV